jgi:GH24 family phage-related lysozyme (muramidase)
MQISEHGLQLLKLWEGFELKVYKTPPGWRRLVWVT